MAKKLDLRQGILWKQILLFSLPIAATSMLQQLFNSADVAVVGRFSAQKELALAAVGSTTSIVNLYITIFTGLAVGANVVIARYLGAGEEGEVRKAVHTSLVAAVVSGAALLVVGQLSAGPLLLWMDTPQDILPLARQYLRIYLLGAIFQMVYNFEAAILRASGDTRRPLLCLLLSGGVNVGLNLLFVIGLHLDVAGVALATVIADVVGAALLWVCLRRETGAIRVEPALLRPDRKLLRAILYIGIPAAVQGMMFNIANVIIQAGINRLGSQVVAASTIGVTAEIFVYYLLNSFGQASMTFTGQNYGAGDLGRCRRATRWCLRCCWWRPGGPLRGCIPPSLPFWPWRWCGCGGCCPLNCSTRSSRSSRERCGGWVIPLCRPFSARSLSAGCGSCGWPLCFLSIRPSRGCCWSIRSVGWRPAGPWRQPMGC